MQTKPAIDHILGGAWRRWLWAPLVALALSLSGCGSGGGDGGHVGPTPEKARATVLVYVVGSDLEGRLMNPDGTLSDKYGNMATYNIEEMKEIGSTPDVNVILETGGAQKDGWRTVRRQRVVKGGTEVLADLGVQRMSDGENLRKFIEWGVKTYPAQAYHLIFWNHGGGPLGGFGVDQNYYPDMKTMPMPEMAAALDGAQRTTGAKIDLIGFDACLMASVEIAHMLSPYAHYLVASEDIEPGLGWDWEAYLKHLTTNPDATAVTTGQAIIDGYVKKMEAGGSNMITLSLIDLAKMETLMDSLGDMAETINRKLGSPNLAQRFHTWSELAYARRATHDYQTSWFYNNAYDLVDLGDFVTMPKLGSLGVSEEQVAAVQAALEDAVIYNKHGQRLWQTSGLTMYSPLVSVKQGQHTSYATLNVPDSLKSLVSNYGDIALSPDLPAPSIGPLQSDGDLLYASLVNPRFSAVEYIGLWQDNTRLAIKPLDGVAPAGAPNEVRVAAHADEGWFTIPSADGTDILVDVLPDDTPRYATGYAQYSIPVYRQGNENDSSTLGVLLVDYMEDVDGDKTYRIVSFLGHQDASPYASRSDSQSLQAGTIFHPIKWSPEKGWSVDQTQKIVSYAVGGDDTPRDQWWQLGTVSAQSLCGGDCRYRFEIIDFQGNTAY
ncbi:MAG: clostripain-related cysteine peptidase [Candidimonas sp.]